MPRSPTIQFYQESIQEYIASLHSSIVPELMEPQLHTDFTVHSSFDRLENRIINYINSLGYFSNLHGMLRNALRVHVNSRYDTTNLTHRFTLLYVGRNIINIDGFAQIVAYRPERVQYHHLPDDEINDISFFDVEYDTPVNWDAEAFNTDTLRDDATNPEQQNEESMPVVYNNQQSTPIDFIINGQKVKCSLRSVYGGSRYVNSIDFLVTSDRGTNLHRILRFIRLEHNKVVIQRSIFRRPVHGFRFVRQLDHSNEIIIKEIK